MGSGKRDPYVIVKVGSRIFSFRDKFIRKTVDPVWNYNIPAILVSERGAVAMRAKRRYIVWKVFESQLGLFEILRCPFPTVIFSTHAISKSLQCSISHSFNPFLSVSLAPSSAYSPLHLHLPSSDIK